MYFNTFRYYTYVTDGAEAWMTVSKVKENPKY